jgi:hypothetical protein
MKQIIVLTAIICAAFQIVTAQKGAAKPDKNEILEMRREVLRELRQTKASGGDRDALAVTVADVGEPDSFGKNAQFIGIAASGVMYVYTSCDPAILLADLGLVLGPDDRCLAAPNPAVNSSATFTDVARINLPAKTAKNVIYMINNHTMNWDFSNFGGAPLSARMNYFPQITIESDALNDPAAIDPNTGLPMGGSYTTTGNGTKFFNTLLQVGDFSTYLDSYTRANTTGLSRTFFVQLGLPASVINNLYNQPMTIRLGARIIVRGVSSGQFVYTARFLGN